MIDIVIAHPANDVALLRPARSVSARRNGLATALMALACTLFCAPGAWATDAARDELPTLPELSNPYAAQAGEELPTPELTVQSPPAVLGDDLWLIDTRQPTPEHPEPCFKRCVRGTWQQEDVQSFVEASADGLPVCVWIHGYQIPAGAAEAIGLDVYQHLRQLAPPEQKFRFVIWSWPSVKNGPYRIDARRKARRSDIEGYKLARVIRALPPEVPVGLLGFSFGSRLTGATLHFLGGGSIAGLCLGPDSACQPREVRAVLLAGALDNDAFATGKLNGCALGEGVCALVLTDRRDPVLFAYRHLEELSGAVAMGHSGPICVACPDRVSTWDVTSWVRVSHDWRRYIHSERILAPVAAMVLVVGAAPAERGSEELHAAAMLDSAISTQ